MTDESEMEKSFWITRPDNWVINREMKKNVLLEFKRTSHTVQSYFQDMWKVVGKNHTPILKGLGTLTADREWEVEVVPLVVGQRSVKEKEWLESFKVFKKIIHRLGYTLLNEYEKLFGDTHLVPPVACRIFWGKTYRSVSPSLPWEGIFVLFF